MADRWLPIRYRDFWDVPRLLVVETGDRVLLLDSAFDDVLDEFSPEYSVYDLPALALASAGHDWRYLSQGGRLLGKIRVSDVTFDDTRRNAILETSIRRFLSE